MKITWIDKKSVLYFNKRKFKAGDVIPAGILSQNRIDSLLSDKKIKIESAPYLKIDMSKPSSIIVGKAESKSKTIEKPVKKSKQELEDEELQKMIDEESNQLPVEPDLMSGMMGGKGSRE